jgi:adenylyltransferase/sulfurtransferase
MLERYIRQIKLSEVGLEGQVLISSGRVLIVGAGALGNTAASYLAGAGVGQIEIMDDDVISLHNLHRQIIFTESDLGKFKCEVLAKHLSSLNSSISITAIKERLNEKNALDELSKADIVLDCSDNIESRYLINDACILLNKVFVSASIYKFEAQLSVFNYNHGPSYRCLYPQAENLRGIATCEDTGVLGTLPGIMGIMQANEVLKILLRRKDVISGKILITNILNYNTSFLSLERNEANFSLVRAQGLKSVFDGSSKHTNELTFEEIESDLVEGKVTLIDIREAHEIPTVTSAYSRICPMSNFDLLKEIVAGKDKYVLFCQSGLRSLVAAEDLFKSGFKNIYSLQGGIDSLSNSEYFELSYEIKK